MDRRKDPDYIDPSEFDIVKTLMILWKRKNIIIFGALFFTILSVIIVLMLPRVYKSSGFLNTYWPYRDVKKKSVKLKEVTIGDIGYKIKLAESKNIIKLVTNNDQIIDFIKYNKGFLGLKEYADGDFGNLIENNLIEPSYAYRTIKKKLDNKQNFLIGFTIKGFGKLPFIAQKNVSILKQYISCIIINKELYEYVNINLNWENSKLLNNRNKTLKAKHKLSQLEFKEREIGKIAKEFPSLDKGDKIILSNIENQNMYLSPLQFQAHMKIRIIDNKQFIKRLEWQSIISKNKIIILESFRNFLRTNKNAPVDLDLINKLDLLFSKHIKKTIESNETNEIAINDIKEKLSYFKQLNNHVFKFTSLPSYPKSPAFPRRKMIVMTVFALSFIFFILLALFIDNWRGKKKIIQREETD